MSPSASLLLQGRPVPSLCFAYLLSLGYGLTLRFSMSDPGTTYRTREEIKEVRSSRDPIAGLKRYIMDWGVDKESKLKAIDKAAKEEVDKAVAEAKESPYPDLKEFWTDIYVSVESHLRLLY